MGKPEQATGSNHWRVEVRRQTVGWGAYGDFARVFRWLFPCRFPWIFPIKQRRDRAVPHGIGDRGDSILPTSPRPIEVWL